ncbi:MAG: FGGY family carbohydrate kinase [Chloroflexota bacterium]|nr:FGGY family carbohydrate kinase [Chloroflexota bacterium]
MTTLVLDIGSSSVRALLYDDAAQLLPDAIARRAHAFTTDADGTSTADARQLRTLIEACIDDILTHPAAQMIQAVGMATFVGNLLGLDAAGQPVTPVYTYADTRCSDACEHLRAQIDTAATHQRTGCPHCTAYHPAKLRWLHQQGIHANQWTDIGTYFYGVWFGRTVPCSYSVASWSGLLNRAALEWDDEWLRLLDLSMDVLPPLADYTCAQTQLTTDYATRWQSLAHVPFYLAVGDGAAANVGAGAVERGQAALTIGTTAALRMITTEALPAVPDGLWSYRVDSRRHLIGGATNEGGSTIAWVRATCNVPDNAEVQLQQRPPDAHGLTFLPLLTGERSPGYNAQATGIIQGVRASTTPLDILQAAMEGVSLRLALIAERLGIDDNCTVYAGGGALRASPAWAQVCADAFNATLHVLDEQETTGRGVALLVLEAVHSPVTRAEVPMTIIEPQAAHVAILRQARARHLRLYETVISPHAPDDTEQPPANDT